MLGTLGAVDPLLARNRRKKKRKGKKRTFCLNGETVSTRNQDKKKRIRKQGGTEGSCPVCTDLQPTADLATTIANAAPGATLRLCPGTFRLTSTLVVNRAVTLVGAGTDQTTLDGGNTIRVLEVDSPDAVVVQGLTITRGLAPVPGGTGGGILNDGDLTLRGVSVTACRASLGGGIFHQSGNLRLEGGSRVAGNSATIGGGIFARNDVVTMTSSSVTGNGASNGGGGIFIQAAAVTLASGSTVAANEADFSGGGAFLQGGTLTLQAGSSLTGNIAGNDGGGVFLQGGTLTLDPGSTLTGNTPDNCEPGQGTCT